MSSATINLVGPSTSPGAPQITPAAINTAVNTALATNWTNAGTSLGTIPGPIGVGGAAQAGAILTVLGQNYQANTNTQPTTDFYHTFLNNAVQYTGNATGGDTIGIASQLNIYANGHTVSAGASQHTCGVYGYCGSGADGNAASTVAFVSGIMGGTGNQGPGTVTVAADFLCHPLTHTGGGTVVNHYGIYQQDPGGATNNYGAFFAGNVGIGADSPTYALQVTPGANNASATNWANIGSGTGTLIMTSGGASLYPGYNPGAGGFGCTDIIVGNNGSQNATNATTNFLYLATSAGPPTGVPAHAGQGAAFGIDATNNKLNLYVSSAWRGIGLNTPATYQAAPSNPTGTANGTGLMMGLAGAITPSLGGSGTVLLTIGGDLASNTIGCGANIQLRYGTGGAPANAAALTGTTAGAGLLSVVSTTAAVLPWSRTAVITGLTPGTAYWLDVSLAAYVGGTASLSQIAITAVELR